MAPRRGHALLVTMYNTGARVQDILDLCPCDLQPDPPRQALLRGKLRCCLPWKETTALVAAHQRG